MSRVEFPSFDEALTKHHAYLALLQVGPETAGALSAIRAAVDRSGSSVHAELAAMLGADNWRPHVIGAVVMLMLPPSPERIATLWNALDRRSGARPQMAAAAAATDPDFALAARARLEGVGLSEHSRKLVSVLVALCGRLPATRVWLEPLRHRTDIRLLLKADVHRHGEAAVRWLDGMTRLLK